MGVAAGVRLTLGPRQWERPLSRLGDSERPTGPSCQSPPGLDPRQAPQPAWSHHGPAPGRPTLAPACGEQPAPAAPGPQPGTVRLRVVRRSEVGARGVCGPPGPPFSTQKSPRSIPNVPVITLISLRIFRTNVMGILHLILGCLFLEIEHTQKRLHRCFDLSCKENICSSLSRWV